MKIAPAIIETTFWFIFVAMYDPRNIASTDKVINAAITPTNTRIGLNAVAKSPAAI